MHKADDLQMNKVTHRANLHKLRLPLWRTYRHKSVPMNTCVTCLSKVNTLKCYGLINGQTDGREMTPMCEPSYKGNKNYYLTNIAHGTDTFLTVSVILSKM